jgi:hypothetical protein
MILLSEDICIYKSPKIHHMLGSVALLLYCNRITVKLYRFYRDIIYLFSEHSFQRCTKYLIWLNIFVEKFGESNASRLGHQYIQSIGPGQTDFFYYPCSSEMINS